MQTPRIAVIIPVYNSARQLDACLESLTRSCRGDYECIVVDDQSTDGSQEVARRHGATVLSSGGRKGPACARNIGASAAKAELLFFIDADVCIYPGTLERVLSAFETDADMTALIGSYDDSPDSPDFISQYKNLMHCYVHQTARREAATFWTGCGAIRRSVFLEIGGFDEHSYTRPAIEDIELGYRLRSAGLKIVLDPQIVVKHLKRWTFWSLLRSDIQDRGIPWTELVLREGYMPNDLNVRVSQRVSVALVFLLIWFSAVLTIQWRGYFLAPFFAATIILLSHYWIDAAAHRSTAAIILQAASILAFVLLSYRQHLMLLIPAVLLTYAILFIRRRVPRHYAKPIRLLLWIAGTYAAVACVSALVHLSQSSMLLGASGILLALLVLNAKFYAFLAEKRGRVFAISALPFHVLYHFYNGIAFSVGVAKHLWKTSQESGRTVAMPRA